MAGGRPKKKLDILPDNWKQTVLDLYAEGAADVEIRCELNISQPLWTRWLEEEEEFYITIKRGRELSEQWWMRHGRKHLENKEFNSTLWYMNMKNRFGWTDKQNIDHTTKGDAIKNVTIRLVDGE